MRFVSACRCRLAFTRGEVVGIRAIISNSSAWAVLGIGIAILGLMNFLRPGTQDPQGPAPKHGYVTAPVDYTEKPNLNARRIEVAPRRIVNDSCEPTPMDLELAPGEELAFEGTMELATDRDLLPIINVLMTQPAPEGRTFIGGEGGCIITLDGRTATYRAEVDAPRVKGKYDFKVVGHRPHHPDHPDEVDVWVPLAVGKVTVK